MSADLLREAAAKMRERAEALSWDDGWYTAREMEDTIARGEGFASSLQAADATHIASFANPAVALAVADWLDHEANHFDMDDTTRTRALAVARAYLGRDA